MSKLKNFLSYLPFIGEPFAAEKMNKQNMDFQTKMADLQYSRDKEMWNEANQYNSPQMQMERLKQAGLNPNMVYGGGSATGNVAQNIPKYQAPNVDFKASTIGNFLPVLSVFQNLKESDARIDAIKAGEENKRADTLLKGINAEVGQIRKHWLPLYQEYGAGLAGSKFRQAQTMEDILGSKKLQEVDKGMLGWYQREIKGMNGLIKNE